MTGTVDAREQRIERLERHGPRHRCAAARHRGARRRSDAAQADDRASCKLQLARRNRAQFGSSSERFEDAQRTLIEAAPLDELAAAKTLSAGRQPTTRRSTAACRSTCRASSTCTGLRQRRRITTATGQACGCIACGGRLRQIGADVAEQLEYVPARFKVIRHVRPKLACVKCQAIFQAAAPSRPDRARHRRPRAAWRT